MSMASTKTLNSCCCLLSLFSQQNCHSTPFPSPPSLLPPYYIITLLIYPVQFLQTNSAIINCQLHIICTLQHLEQKTQQRLARGSGVQSSTLLYSAVVLAFGVFDSHAESSLQILLMHAQIVCTKPFPFLKHGLGIRLIHVILAYTFASKKCMQDLHTTQWISHRSIEFIHNC